MNKLDLIIYVLGLAFVVVLLGNIVFSVVFEDQHIKDNSTITSSEVLYI